MALTVHPAQGVRGLDRRVRAAGAAHPGGEQPLPDVRVRLEARGEARPGKGGVRQGEGWLDVRDDAAGRHPGDEVRAEDLAVREERAVGRGAAGGRQCVQRRLRHHYMVQPLVELYGGCVVVLKVS